MDTMTQTRLIGKDLIAALAKAECIDCGRNGTDLSTRGHFEGPRGTICTDCIAKSETQSEPERYTDPLDCEREGRHSHPVGCPSCHKLISRATYRTHIQTCQP